MKKDKKSPGGRIPELDSIRGLAALAVLVTHLPRGFWFGETGVDLFFILSGYLITSIILKNSGRPGFYRTFFARRAFRIWPIYYLSILALTLLSFFRSTPTSYEGAWYYLTYLQNVTLYWGEPTPPFLSSLGHTWTLAIEEQFYILWPIVLVLFGRPAVAPLAFAMVAAPYLFREAGLDRTTLLGHTDGFGWGAALSLLVPTNEAARVSPRARRIGIAGFALAAVAAGIAYAIRADAVFAAGATAKQAIRDSLGISLINASYCGLVGVIILAAGSPALKPLRLAPLVYLGQISYGLYLYHWIIYEQIDTAIKFGLKAGDPYWLDLLKVAASFATAICSWHFVELPFLKVKDRFAYGIGVRKAPLPGPSPAVAKALGDTGSEETAALTPA
jgi:peptidoglycan/LPS O-acetylase OafA/YrhL